jgi:pyrroline-5-carboxylate reductase
MKTKSLGFIGGGRITGIFLQALSNSDADFSSIVVSDTNTELLTGLKKKFPVISIADSPSLPAQQDIVFFALHPPVIMETLDLLKDHVKPGSTIISLAPKISMEKIASKFPHVTNIVRLIPNATSIINEGYNPVCFAKDMPVWDKQTLLETLRLLGHTFEVPEPKLESYAIMSAMLPTYFWFQIKELIELGSRIGLTVEESQNSVRDTLVAAIKTYFYSGLQPDEVIDLVPVKPIGENEAQIKAIYNEKLLSLFGKIKP